MKQELKCLKGHRHVMVYVLEEPKEKLIKLDCVLSLIGYIGSSLIENLAIDYYLLKPTIESKVSRELEDYELFQVFWDEDDYED